MAYDISWYVNQRVLFLQVAGQMEIEEFERFHAESFAFVQTSPHKVHAIVDLSQFNAVPSNLRMLSAATSDEKSHNQGMTVLVMPKLNSMFLFLASVIMQTLRLEYRICESMEEAIRILKNIDADLATMQMPDREQPTSGIDTA